MVLPAAPSPAGGTMASSSARLVTNCFSSKVIPLAPSAFGRRPDHPLEGYFALVGRVEFLGIAMATIDRVGDQTRCQAIADPGHRLDPGRAQGFRLGLQRRVDGFLRQA